MLKSSWSDPPIFFPTAGCPPECVSLAFVQQDHPSSPPPHLSKCQRKQAKFVKPSPQQKPSAKTTLALMKFTNLAFSF